MRSPTKTAATAKASMPQVNTHAGEVTSPQLLGIVEFDGLDDLDDVWPPPTSDFFGFDDADFMDIVGEDFEAANEFHDLLPNPFDSSFECSTCPTSEVSKQCSLSLDSTSLKNSAQIVARSQQPQRQKRRIPRKKRIEDLRELVAALSLQLDNIKKASSVTGRLKIHREIDCAQLVWKSIATRQLNLRLKAEENNASLRKLLQLHKNEVKNMKRRFKRRIDEEYMDLPILRMPNLVSNQDNTRIFADLLRDIDELYVGVDAFFQRKTMDAVPCPGRTCQNYSQTGNTAMTYTQYVCKAFDRTTHVEEHGVVRKYVNDAHTVFVSRTASKLVGDYGDLKYRETVCLIVKSGKPLASEQETAIIEVHSSVARFDDGSSTAKKFRTRRFTSLAVQGWKNKASLKKQEVENLLFVDTAGDQ